MNYDVIPTAIKNLNQWVTWTYEGARKVPYNAKTGKRASSTNAQTWVGFPEAVKAAQERRHTGVGFVFTPEDPYTGIDLDDCIEGDTIAPWALDILKTMDSYSEISPSGTGIKIWVEGKLPQNIKTQNIEIYSSARYFTVTGRHIETTPLSIRNVNGALERLAASVRPVEEEVEQHHNVLSARVTDASFLRQWADGVVDSALARVRAAPLGTKHNTLLDMSRLLGGLIPLGLADEATLITLLSQATDAHSEHPQTARTTIRDGLAMGMQKPLVAPEPPAQPLFDTEGFACCPQHSTRLPIAKNGNGYKCHERDASTASGWCDFWWKGEGYVEPSVFVAGELITQTPIATALAAPRFVLYKLSGLRALPPATWLVQGEIPASLTTIICGPSGAGKSFLMVDYVMRIARANPDRIVVYIAPEGGSGYHLRTQAWLQYFGGDEPENLVFLLQAVPMLDPKSIHDLITVIRPYNPVMVVVDTLARCLVGGDENSAKDIGLFFFHTDMIRQETSAAIAVVHHTGKSGQFRGSSALYGSVESWIDVANDDGLITVSCGKSKDTKPFAPRYLRMVESCESVVLVPADQVSQHGSELTEAQRKILETLALDIFTTAGARRSELVSASGVNDVTMYRVLSRLKRDGYITQSKKGDPYFISPEGMSAIRAYHRELRRQRNVIVEAENRSNYHEGGVKDFQNGGGNYQRPNAQLSQLSPNYHELSTDSFHQLSNYHQFSPSLEGDKLIVSSEKTGGDSDLFPEDNTTTEAIEQTPPPDFNWDEAREMYQKGNVAALKVRCSIARLNFDEVLAQIEQSLGITPEPYDED